MQDLDETYPWLFLEGDDCRWQSFIADRSGQRRQAPSQAVVRCRVWRFSTNPIVHLRNILKAVPYFFNHFP